MSHVESSVQKQVLGPSRRNEIHRFNGELRLNQYTWERHRERERVNTQKALFKKYALNQMCALYIRVFNEHVLYKS